LAVVVLVFYFVFYKKTSLKDEFDGNFDPLAVLTPANIHRILPRGAGAAGAGAATMKCIGRPGAPVYE